MYFNYYLSSCNLQNILSGVLYISLMENFLTSHLWAQVNLPLVMSYWRLSWIIGTFFSLDWDGGEGHRRQIEFQMSPLGPSGSHMLLNSELID